MIQADGMPFMEELRPLVQRCNTKGLAHGAAHILLLICTGFILYLSQTSLWVYPATVVYGAVVVALFAPLHECIHRTAFASRWLNDIVAGCAGLVLFIPPAYFREFHMEHHRFTQDPNKDPELSVAKPANRWQLLVYVSGIPFWRERLTTTMGHALGTADDSYISTDARHRVIVESRWFMLIYLAAAMMSVSFDFDGLWRYWLLPVMAGQPLLRLFLLAEHTGCAEVPHMLVNSRTTQSNAVIRLLTWNMPYHTEHHVCPAVPFHGLPAAHRILGERVQVQGQGYVSFHRQLWRSLGTGC